MFTRRVPGRGYSTTALTFAALTVILPLLVVGGVGFGVAAKRRGDPWGQRTIITSLVCLGVGIVLAIVASNIDLDNVAMTPHRA